MERSFLDIQVGDIVIVYDEYGHDCEQHYFKVESIEYDKEYINGEVNPKGMRCYGIDLDCWDEEFQEYDTDDYIGVVTEGNFCGFVKEREHLWVCEHCLAAVQSHEGNQAILTHSIDSDDIVGSQCDWCKEVGFDTLYELV